MAKNIIEMNEKEFATWAMEQVVKSKGGEGGQKVLDYIINKTKELEKMMLENGDINFTEEDYNVIATFANLTLGAYRCHMISKEMVADLNSTQLSLLFCKGGKEMYNAAVNVLDPEFRPTVVETLMNTMKGDE